MKLPDNPQNGQLVSLENGQQLKYIAATKTWVEMDQLATLATEFKDGLMSAEEYAKLNRLVLPPPISTLQANDCPVIEQGVISLQNSDGLLRVNEDVTIKDDGNYEYRIHRNTAGINVELDINALLQELEKRGQIKYVAKAGKKGDKGKRGEDGLDSLEVGPYGQDGRDGQTPSNTITVANDSIEYANDNSAYPKVITNIVPDETTGTFVVYRSIAGNPNAAPDKVNVSDGESTWLLVTAPISSSNSNPAELYYLDIAPILRSIKEKYNSEVERIKKGYEDIASFWLSKMSVLFESQKAALCCALERCMSKNKSMDMRRYLESQRIQARQAGMQLDIQQDASNDTTIVKVGQTSLCSTVDLTKSTPTIVKSFAISKPSTEKLTISIDGLNNIGQGRAVNIDLPAGEYLVTIDECCIRYDGRYDGAVTLLYDDGAKQARFLDYGKYTELSEAESAYLGSSVKIIHTGGKLSAFYDAEPVGVSFGNIGLKIELLDSGTFVTDEIIAHYKDLWNTNNCYGAVISLNGQDFIIVRPVDIDSNTITMSNSIVALAFPTFDGINFVDLEISELIDDSQLYQIATSKIANGQFSTFKGSSTSAIDFANKFTKILFPANG